MSDRNAAKELYERIHRKTTFTEQIRFTWWCMFKKYKLVALDDGLKSGLSARQAFDLADQADENYTHTGGRAKATTTWRRVLKSK